MGHNIFIKIIAYYTLVFRKYKNIRNNTPDNKHSNDTRNKIVRLKINLYNGKKKFLNKIKNIIKEIQIILIYWYITESNEFYNSEKSKDLTHETSTITLLSKYFSGTHCMTNILLSKINFDT